MAGMHGANLDAVIGRAVRDADFRKRLLSDSQSIPAFGHERAELSSANAR